MSRKIRAFVLVSILLNIFLSSILIGHFIRVMGRPGQIPGIDAGQYNISEEQLTRIREQLHAAHLANKDIFVLAARQRKKALQVLADEPFDAAAYQGTVDAIQNLRGRSMQRTANAVKNMALNLDANERAALAEILRNPAPPPPGSRPQ